MKYCSNLTHSLQISHIFFRILFIYLSPTRNTFVENPVRIYLDLTKRNYQYLYCRCIHKVLFNKHLLKAARKVITLETSNAFPVFVSKLASPSQTTISKKLPTPFTSLGSDGCHRILFNTSQMAEARAPTYRSSEPTQNENQIGPKSELHVVLLQPIALTIAFVSVTLPRGPDRGQDSY